MWTWARSAERNSRVRPWWLAPALRRPTTEDDVSRPFGVNVALAVRPERREAAPREEAEPLRKG
ncbi:MAG: hypothetical protein AVDCRST_MAG04-257 [uncultured Acetobacteraceae bacterium]|uniref:Uncharacterized protein n=1 Tax=uncultured Acetobacteraceae bacterium TaxID=169975 RepID=A0A6J4H522_9PROT|nr:MAG: hypothetical protein AVDCRST_MAG04-257 [uncultured Acetobacteraceae bacterium]